MDSHTFYTMIESKRLSPSVRIDEIESLIEKYPACQSIYLLRGFLLNQQSDTDFQMALPKIAARVSDRGRLYDMVQEYTQWTIGKDESEVVEIEESTVDEEQELNSELEEILEQSNILIEENVGEKHFSDEEIDDDSLVEDVSITAIPSDEVVDESLTIKKEVFEVPEEVSDMTFVEWLKHKNKVGGEEGTPNSDIPFEMPSQIEAELMLEGQRTKDQLEDFISTQLKRKREKKPITSQEIISTNQPIVSETYAEILLLQKKYTEAIKTYQTLSLKYPQKSSFFARQIEKIKKHL